MRRATLWWLRLCGRSSSPIFISARGCGQACCTRPGPLRAVLLAIDGVDRLVLLGDTVELARGAPSRRWQSPQPVLRAVGARLGARAGGDRRPRQPRRRPGAGLGRGPGARRSTADRRRAARRQSGAVRAGPLAGAGAGASAHYPGVWLAEGVWATHGHYLDRHLLPESAFGIARGLLGRLPRDGARADRLRARAPPVAGRRCQVAATPAGGAARGRRRACCAPRRCRGVRAGCCTAVRAADRALLGAQMRRASIPALGPRRPPPRRRRRARSCSATSTGSGRWPPTTPAQWRGPAAGRGSLNTGSWVYEPLLVHRAPAPPLLAGRRGDARTRSRTPCDRAARRAPPRAH